MGVVLDFEAAREQREAEVAGREPRLTKRQIAGTLMVSERTIENWMRRGMPFEKPFAHGSVRFVWSDVESWMRR